MKKAISVEEAKRHYMNSKFSNGRDYGVVIVIKDGMMETISKSKWSTEESVVEDMKKIEKADMLFDYGF